MGDQQIKVLMMLDSFDIGGTETHVLSLTQELIKQGVSVFVAGYPGKLEAKFRALPCKIYNYKNNRKKLAEWIRDHQINLIHAHMPTSGKQAIRLSRQLKIPLICTFHGTYYSNSFIDKLLHESTGQPAIISVSVPVKNWLKRKGIASIRIPNGINMNEFHPRKSALKENLNIPKKSRIMLYASRLEDEKYDICKMLLQVCENKLLRQFPKMHLLIAGGGNKAEKIERFIKDNIRSRRIQYVGNRSDMSDLYAISDYVVGTGRVALEGISCERPVIAIGTKGVFGLVTPDNFPVALKYYFCDHKKYLPLNESHMQKAIIQGLHAKDHTMSWCKQLRQTVIETIDITVVTDRLCKLYKKKLREASAYEL